MRPEATLAGGTSATAPRQAERAALRKAACGFEALLLQTLIGRMREAQLEGGFFGDSTGSSIYEGILADSLAEHLAPQSPLGIARLLEAQWAGGRPEEAGAARDALDRIEALRARQTYGANSSFPTSDR